MLNRWPLNRPLFLSRTSNDSMDTNEQVRQIAIRLREIEDANAALTRRVFSLETELSKVTGSPIHVQPPIAAPPPLPSVPVMATTLDERGIVVPLEAEVPTYTAPPPFQPVPSVPQADAPTPPPTIEGNFGLTWINRIGVLTLVLGVGFFFKYMVDNDWIGPSGRVMLGVLAGLLTIWFGDRLWHKDQKTFAQGVQALGTSILYLSFFAAFRFYELIPQSVAFVLMLVTTLMTGALALRYNAQATLALGMISGWCTPFLLSKGEPNDLFFLSYMLLLNGGAAIISRMRGWTSIEIVALVATWVFHLAWTENRSRIAGRNLSVLFTMLNYAVFAVSSHGWIVVIAQLIAGLLLGYSYNKEWNSVVLLVGFLHFLAGLFLTNRNKIAGGALAAVGGFWLCQATADQPDRLQHLSELMLGYTAAFLTTLAFVVYRATKDSVQRLDLAAASLCGVIYFTASYDLLVPEYKAYLGLFTVAVAACYLALGYALYNDTPAEKRDTTGPLLAAGLALAFLALAVPIQLTGYRITIGWAIQAGALTWIAYKLRDSRIVIGSAILYFLAVSRLGSIDSLLYWPPIEGGYALFFNPRFITFLVTCLSLWFSAWCASKFEEHKPIKTAAGIAYLLGHFLMIWALHLELFAYVDSRLDFNSPTSLKTLISSIILAGYGMLFISFGFARRAALPRILGLILFGIVILKLYLYDIWLLDRIYRMIAFIALGGILLGGSYLYSRFRDKLTTLIRDTE